MSPQTFRKLVKDGQIKVIRCRTGIRREWRRRGGLTLGRTRAFVPPKRSKQQRKERAQKVAAARWAKRKEKE